MKLQVLGCAGGIGGQERLTTCFRVDEDILLDAGTGLGGLDIEQLKKIDHVFLSHAHLDHVVGLALLVDAVLGKRRAPVAVHATPQVIAALKAHLFNWVLWPDFSEIPDALNPVFIWAPMEHGDTVCIGERVITSHAVNHSEGAAGYWVRQGDAGFLFSGDLSSTPALWKTFANERALRKVIVDCSFPNAEEELAAKSKHFCPRALLADIERMPRSAEFLIYHLKPGQEELIMRELAGADRQFTAIRNGDEFVF